MKIPVHYSLKVARAVVAKIDLPKEVAKNCTVESWSNCREQGLCIKKYDDSSKAVLIAQQRSSDEILLVCGILRDFDFQTNQPSEELWNIGRVHFDPKDVKKAAKHIEKFLTS